MCEVLILLRLKDPLVEKIMSALGLEATCQKPIISTSAFGVKRPFKLLIIKILKGRSRPPDTIIKVPLIDLGADFLIYLFDDKSKRRPDAFAKKNFASDRHL